MKLTYFNTIKSFLSFCFAVLAAVFFVSCNKDEELLVDLTAYVADDYAGDAKVSIDASQYACWETGDEVNVNGKSYPVTVSGSYKTATIVGVEKDDNSDYTAVYPASCAGVVTPGSSTVDITLPSTQTWDASHIFSPMVATYNGSQLNFHNPCNLLAVTVTNKTGNPLIVHSIIVESTVNNITGTFTVSGCNGENPTTAYTGSDGGKTITLDCGNQSVDNSAVFYVSVPKVEGETFHFSVNAKTDATKYTFAKNSRELTITNNKYIPITVATDDAAVSSDPYFWGKGSTAYPYLITDYNDLKNLSYVVHNATDDTKYNAADRYYLQTGNFTITDANWGSSDRLAVGSTTNTFKANYNGGNHTITFSGVSSVESEYPVGVFGVVGGGASISNLTVAGSIDLGDSDGDIDAGGVAGKVTGAATFTSCTNQATVTSTYTTAADYGVGGICGAVDATDSTVTFTSCTNSAQIKAYGLKNGGIVGLSTAGTLNFSSCTNSGDIVSFDGSSTYYDHCGGIIGMVNSSNGTVTMTSCVNNGAITGNGSIGGFIGQTNRACEITGTSSNNGDITGNGASVAGVIGFVQSNATITIHGTRTTNNNPIVGGYNVAGIVGFTNGAITLENCWNDGEILATTYSDGNYGVAGILARIDASSYNMTINHCKNMKKIESTANGSRYYIGGIVGYSNTKNNNSRIVNCYNIGNLTGNELHIGGIVAEAHCIIVANCYNQGNMSGNLETTNGTCGGIVGDCYGSSMVSTHSSNNCTYSYIDNCYNKGTITGITVGLARKKREITVRRTYVYVANCYGITTSLISNFSDKNADAYKLYQLESFDVETGDLANAIKLTTINIMKTAMVAQRVLL